MREEFDTHARDGVTGKSVGEGRPSADSAGPAQRQRVRGQERLGEAVSRGRVFRELSSRVSLKLPRVAVHRLRYPFALTWTRSEEGRSAGRKAVCSEGCWRPPASDPQVPVLLATGNDSWPLFPLPRCGAGLSATQHKCHCSAGSSRPGLGTEGRRPSASQGETLGRKMPPCHLDLERPTS